MTIRVNPLKQPVADFEKLLSEKGIEAAPIPYLPEGFTIKSGANHFFGTFLKEGLAYVQSASSMVPAKVLSPKAGRRSSTCARPLAARLHRWQK